MLGPARRKGHRHQVQSLSVCLLKAGLDGDGWPIATKCVTRPRGISATWASAGCRRPLLVPNYRLTPAVPMNARAARDAPRKRAEPNAFYMEGFIDELAHAAGKDRKR